MILIALIRMVNPCRERLSFLLNYSATLRIFTVVNIMGDIWVITWHGISTFLYNFKCEITKLK